MAGRSAAAPPEVGEDQQCQQFSTVQYGLWEFLIARKNGYALK